MSDAWTIRDLGPADAPACDAVVATLPYFFGQPAGIAHCAAAVRTERGLVAVHTTGAAVGFLTYHRHHVASAEITWMAVRQTERRQGVGRLLVQAIRSVAAKEGVEQIFVITLGPSVAEPGLDDSYGGTRAFYEAVGFVALKELDIWGSDSAGIVLTRCTCEDHERD